MNKTIFNIFESVIGLINNLIYLLISLSLVGFMWGIVKFVFAGGNEKARSEGRQFMIYGILTLFVMTSMWGIVYLMKDFISVNGGAGGSTNTQTTNPGPAQNNSFDGQGDVDFDDLDRY